MDPLPLHSLPLLFADDSSLVGQHGLTRDFHPARTRSEPVLRGDQPWESTRVYIYGTVHFDPAIHQYRMWYMSRSCGGRKASHGSPELRFEGYDRVLHATSPDGVHWQKPQLGIHNYAGSMANNIVYDLHSPTVLVDPSDPSRPYKMMGSLPGNYYSASSPDGLHWQECPGNPKLTASDTITLARDPRTGEYLAYHKHYTEIRGFKRRAVWLARSPDFSSWGAPELVLAPDEQDDQWVTEPGQRTEIYNMSVFPHAGGFLGLPAIFRVTAERPRSEIVLDQSALDGPLDIQIASSADGRRWQRPDCRPVMIPRGAHGSFDAGAILGVATSPVNTESETWVYYTAITTGHGAPLGPKQVSIGRAEWRRDGFVSLAAAQSGHLLTVPLLPRGEHLAINADATGGEIRAALCDAEGRTIPGYSLEESLPIEGDHLRAPLRWRGNHALPAGQAVQVSLTMERARLYSIVSA